MTAEQAMNNATIIRVGSNTTLGPKAKRRIAAIARLFAARLVDNPIPQDGDAVILHGRNGKTYKRGHLEDSAYKNNADELSYCTQPMRPHIHFMPEPGEAAEASTQASGGYWGAVSRAELRHVGTTDKAFWTWGEGGPGAHCGITFLLTVNQWEYTNTERIY